MTKKQIKDLEAMNKRLSKDNLNLAKEIDRLNIKNNDPFGFKKAIDTSVIDKLTPKELDEAAAAAGLGLSRDDFSDDGADLQDLKEIYEGDGS
tara:strand:- start:123 stop:401 length:279 start_codon:yes stop_codon:yes gene_type:complete